MQIKLENQSFEDVRSLLGAVVRFLMPCMMIVGLLLAGSAQFVAAATIEERLQALEQLLQQQLLPGKCRVFGDGQRLSKHSTHLFLGSFVLAQLQ